MNSRAVKKQLASLRHGHDRIAPDSAWVLRNRALLLSQMNNTVDARPVAFSVRAAKYVSQAARLFLPQNIIATARSVSFVSLAALVAVGGWIASVSAAQNSLPGDALYNVKRASEKTELLVASVVGGEKSKVKTLLKHASNRVEEYRKSKTPDQAKVAIQSLKESIASTSKSLDQAGAESAPDAVLLAQTVNEKTEELLDSLHVPSTNDSPGMTMVGTAAVDLEEELGEATHLIEVAGVRAVQVLAEQTLAGNEGVSEADVKATVEKKLDDLVSGFSALNKDAAVVTTAVASTSLQNVPDTVSIASDTLSISTETLTATGTATTPMVLSPPDDGVPNPALAVNVTEAVKATEQKAIEASKIVDKTVAEAKTLIQNNDLLGAIKKVEALTEFKKDAGDAVIQAKRVTNIAAPVTASSTVNAQTTVAPAPVR